MNKNSLRGIATPATALLFIVMAISGVMLFFEFFGKYVKELHEILGLGFVGVALLHLSIHWKAFKNYFAKTEFKLIAIAVVLASAFFVGQVILKPHNTGVNPKKMMMDSLIKADLKESLKILNIDYTTAITTLKKENINIESANSLAELSKSNKKSPYEIVRIILKK